MKRFTAKEARELYQTNYVDEYIDVIEKIKHMAKTNNTLLITKISVKVASWLEEDGYKVSHHGGNFSDPRDYPHSIIYW